MPGPLLVAQRNTAGSSRTIVFLSLDVPANRPAQAETRDMLPAIARGSQAASHVLRAGRARVLASRRRMPPRRTMAGHDRKVGLPNEHVPIEVPLVDRMLGQGFIMMAALWMMYRAKEDGAVLLVSVKLKK